MELTPTLLWYSALVLAVGALRLFELRISARRRRALAARGLPPVEEPHYREMVLFHTGMLIGCLVEAWLARRPPIPAVAGPALGLLLLANALRWWVIATLGPHWNVQIMGSLPLGVVTGGPYRFVRHPNYVAVFLEFVALPLVHSAWAVAAVGAALHVWVLSHRIRAEEAMLFASDEYRRLMGDKPRFLPRLAPGRERR
jgi:methyltransferase